jgi:3-keto-disaccharide hydrolase
MRAPMKVKVKRRLRWALLPAALAVGVLAVVAIEAARPWEQGDVRGPWRLVFTGYGAADDRAGTVTLAPSPPARDSETHASLVVSERHYGDLVATVRVRTDRQLRPGSPNPWEVGWVLWHYRSPEHFYAVVLKPTGWELTKQDPSFPGNQQFLATGEHPRFAVGRWHTVRISQIGQEITVSADGAVLTRFTDDDPSAYRDGALGLYCEDAEVRFTGFQIAELSG